MASRDRAWNLSAKEPTTIQVLKWALSHAPVVLTGCAIIGSGYLALNRLEVQWQEHVAPNCKETPQAGVCKIERMERKMDSMQQTLDAILLRLPPKR